MKTRNHRTLKLIGLMLLFALLLLPHAAMASDSIQYGPEFDPSSFSATPKRATAGDTVISSVKASDASGKLANKMQLHFNRPISKQDWGTWLDDEDGDGTYLGTLLISSDMEPGEWSASFVSISDSAEYSAIYSSKGISDLSFEVTKDTIPNRRTIRYTDGMGGQAFDDVMYSCSDGDAMPPFTGTIKVDFWTIAGWSPSIAKTVNGDAVYTAKLEVHPDYSVYVDEGAIALSYSDNCSSTSLTTWTVEDSTIGHITSAMGEPVGAGYTYHAFFQPDKAGNTKVFLQAEGRGTIATIYIEVLPSRKIDISDGTIGDIPESVIYTPNDNAVHPKVSVDDKTLKEGTDYDLEYKRADVAGTATVTAVGKGSYRGSLSAMYRILPRPLADVTLGIIPDNG